MDDSDDIDLLLDGLLFGCLTLLLCDHQLAITDLARDVLEGVEVVEEERTLSWRFEVEGLEWS